MRMPSQRVLGARRYHKNEPFNSLWGNQGGLPGEGDAKTKTYTDSAIRIIQVCLFHWKSNGDGQTIARHSG